MPLTSPSARSLTLALCVGACLQGRGTAQAQPAVALDEISVTAPGRSGDVLPGAVGVPSPFAEPLPGIAPALKTRLSPSVSALPANTTVIDAAQIARLPVQNYVDVFRPLAGVDVSNFGQGGVGNGIALRGFDISEHARNIAFYIDGVPINEVSSIHIPNYVDLNPLIPETVRTVGVVRGPFSVEAGDGALGGAVFIETKRADPFNTVSVSGGSFDTVRGLATFSQAGPGLQPFLAYEGYNSGGYRQNADLGRFNAFNKVTIPLDLGSSLSVRVQTYATTFGEPGYIARDLVRAGFLSPRTAFNPTDGGSKTAQNVVANYVNGAPDDELSAVFYASHDVFGRFSDFGGGQSGQVEERETVGGRLRKVWTTSLFDILPTQVLVGGAWRTDRIDVVTGPSLARSLTGRTLDLGILQTDLSAYAQVQVQPAPWLKLTGGARFDQFVFDVNNRLDPTASPKVSPNVVSPKGGAALAPFEWLELFANYGQGFRSPSATGELTSNPRLTPQTIDSTEGGGRLILDRASLTGTVFFTDIANEIFQAAPDLPVQNLGRSRRDGFEIEARYIAYQRRLRPGDAVRELFGCHRAPPHRHAGGLRAERAGLPRQGRRRVRPWRPAPAPRARPHHRSGVPRLYRREAPLRGRPAAHLPLPPRERTDRLRPSERLDGLRAGDVVPRQPRERDRPELRRRRLGLVLGHRHQPRAPPDAAGRHQLRLRDRRGDGDERIAMTRRRFTRGLG